MLRGTDNWMREIRSLSGCVVRDLELEAREFSAGDLVLRKAIGNIRDTNVGNLAPTWEGPYRIMAIAGAGAYYLEELDERLFPRPWNVHNLKKFYQ